MNYLKVTNGYETAVPGLARNKSLLALSQKRITKAAREALRKEYGDKNVEVSCSAQVSVQEWHGECKLSGVEHQYTISGLTADTENYPLER